LPRGKEPSVLIWWEAGWAPEPVWKQWRGEKIPTPELNIFMASYLAQHRDKFTFTFKFYHHTNDKCFSNIPSVIGKPLRKQTAGNQRFSKKKQS
jgi:hypothetical protein